GDAPMTSPLPSPSPPPAAAPPPPKPYRGIESFRYVDQQIFFLREAETQRLVRYVTLYRGVLLYGDSGAGKSSLINAGLVPAALAEGFTPDRLRVQPRPNEEIVVERIPVVADSRPLYLPSNFAGDGDESSQVVLSIRAFRNTLKYLRTLRPDCRPLLIFDQFEEFVTLFEKSATGEGANAAREAQEAILQVLVEVLRDQTLPVKIILAFREDYLAKLNKLFTLCPNLPDQFLRLTPPRVELLHHIIRGPFEKFPGHFRQELSEQLAESIAEAISNQSETGALNLSEVQIACLRLWQSRNPEALFRHSGVEGLLEDYLSESVGLLDAELRDPASALLTRMVTASGTRNVISAEDLIALVHSEERTPPEQLQKALDALERDTRLVRRERRHDTYFYEIVSEFLIPWIARQKQERAEQRLARRAERKRARAYLLSAACLLVAVIAIVVARDRIKKNEEAVNKDREVQEAKRETANTLNRLITAEALNKRLEESNRDLKRWLEEAEVNRDLNEFKFGDAWTNYKNLYNQYTQLQKDTTEVVLPEPRKAIESERQKVTVSFSPWPSEPDSSSGDAIIALRNFGYQIKANQQAESPPPDTIRCGSQVEVEDIQRVSLSLMLAGVRIKKIEPNGKPPLSILLTRSAKEESAVHSVEGVEGFNYLPKDVCSRTP
ncbi:MAG TPA: hypothetical protein VNC59_04060, partial [Thermoanaerobaculia bacterium]|nr:hypothetical protein [Thermoanaerobaculia bacterium]